MGNFYKNINFINFLSIVYCNFCPFEKKFEMDNNWSVANCFRMFYKEGRIALKQIKIPNEMIEFNNSTVDRLIKRCEVKLIFIKGFRRVKLIKSSQVNLK